MLLPLPTQLTPDPLHVVPVVDNAAFDWVVQGEDASPDLRLVPNVTVLKAHAQHHARVARSAHDGGENRSRDVVPSKASLPRPRATVNHQSIVVGHILLGNVSMLLYLYLHRRKNDDTLSQQYVRHEITPPTSWSFQHIRGSPDLPPAPESVRRLPDQYWLFKMVYVYGVATDQCGYFACEFSKHEQIVYSRNLCGVAYSRSVW